MPDIGAPANEASPQVFSVPDAFRIAIVNGVVQQAGTAPAGVIAGTVDGGVLTERDDVLVRLNAGLCGTALSLDLDNDVTPDHTYRPAYRR